MSDNGQRRPGQWPVPRTTPADPATAAPPAPVPVHRTEPVFAPEEVPAVQWHITVDLSGPEVHDYRSLYEVLWQGLRFDATGAHVHVVVGELAVHDTALPRVLAGHTLGAAAVHVAVAPGVAPAMGRLFAADLARQCRSVLADHRQVLAELQAKAGGG